MFYYTPYIILPLLSAIVNGGLAIYTWQRRQVPAARWLAWLLIGMSLWSLFYALTICGSSLWIKNLAFKFSHTSFAVVLYSSVPMTLIMLGKSRWLTRWFLLGTAVVPVISTLAGWTNDLFGLIRYNLHLVQYQQLILFGYTDGPYYTQFHIKYVYLYFLVMIGLCLWGMIQRQQPRRLGFMFVALATVVPLMVDMLNLSPIKELRFTTSVGWITGIFYCLAVFQGQMLKLVPLAKNTLFEQMQEPVLVIDKDGRLAEGNQAAFNHLQLQSDAIGQLLESLFPFGHALHGLNQCQQTVVRQDELSGHRWQITQSSLTWQGLLIGQMLVLHDITDLHQAQEELRLNEERFRRLADESADMVWQLDTNLNFTYVNAADQVLRGFPKSDVVGTSVFSILSPADVEKIRQVNAERMLQEQQGIRTGAMRYELRMLRKDGSYIWTEVHANPLRNVEGLITGFIGVTRDISRRKADEHRMGEALLKEQEMRGEQERFFDMISHEYRTPLAIIQSNIDLLELKRCPECTASIEPLTKMGRAVERLVDIFESFRRRKGIDQRTFAPVLERIEAASCFSDTLNAARDFWGDRFVILNQPATGFFVQADRHLLRTAVLNLLDNAVKYSPEGEPVTLTAVRDGEQLIFYVVNRSAEPLQNDTGQLFQKYRRGGNSVGTSGTGVGLYLATGIIEQMGGTLEMRVVEGCEVTVSMALPLERSE